MALLQTSDSYIMMVLHISRVDTGLTEIINIIGTPIKEAPKEEEILCQ